MNFNRGYWEYCERQVKVMEPEVEAPTFTPEDEEFLLTIHISPK